MIRYSKCVNCDKEIVRGDHQEWMEPQPNTSARVCISGGSGHRPGDTYVFAASGLSPEKTEDPVDPRHVQLGDKVLIEGTVKTVGSRGTGVKLSSGSVVFIPLSDIASATRPKEKKTSLGYTANQTRAAIANINLRIQDIDPIHSNDPTATLEVAMLQKAVADLKEQLKEVE